MFPKKILTFDFVEALTNKQREILLRTILKGDGTCKRYASGGEHWSLTQKNKQFVDNFQILAFLVGHRTVIRFDPNDNCYRVAVHRKDPQCELTAIKRERIPYSGKVWCIQTRNNTLVARRNGRIYISGNSPTEQKLRQIVPFYTWIRGNLGNQITGMMQFTEMYSLLPKATEAARMEGGPEQQDFPEWMREGGYIPISESAEGMTRFFWPNFPYQDVNKIPIKFEMRDGLPMPVAQDPRELLRDIAQDAHPAIKSIIGIIGDVDVFRETPLGETRKAPRLMRAFTKAPGMLPFLDGLLRTFGFQEGLRADVNKKGQLMIDSGMAYVLENNVLLLERIPKMMDPLMFIPAINKLKEQITGAEDDYEGLEKIFQSLSFYAGIKLKERDLKEEEFRRNQEMIEEARAERRRQPKYQVGRERRSMKWKQQQTALQRRLGL